MKVETSKNQIKWNKINVLIPVNENKNRKNNKNAFSLVRKNKMKSI